MSSLYQMTGKLLAQWAGEDAGVRTDNRKLSKQIVDMIIEDIRQHGFPAMDQAAAHDEPPRFPRNAAA